MVTVLIIDDEAYLNRLHELALNEVGFETVSAKSVTEAMGLLQTLTPDVILLDMSLPDGTGIALYDDLRATPRFRHTQVIAMSGGSHFQQAALARGIEYFLQKPIDTPMLLDLVRRVVTVKSERK
jgi:CheY-like chemotaxis protein